jgi:hypothetical protein
MNTRRFILRLAGAMVCMVAVGSAVAACSDDSTDAAPMPRNDGGNNQDTGSASDGGNDVDPSCQSDASTCNSCTTPANDPYNACSEQAANCVPFDNNRVPKENGQIPQVP